ncbi:glycosyltransferase family 1 protein [Paraburkholderia phymatum]|uniref:glycosyltransferase family 4 protein n=1 Tax=Paraburkholderia phymatum TaxID=148447 RepID=UPI00317EE568
MGGRALLTPLTGIGQYAFHLAQEFVRCGHDVRFFYGTHWSSSLAAGNASASSASLGSFSLRTQMASVAKRFARRHMPCVYRYMPHVEQFRFDSGVRRSTAPHVYHDPNFIPFRFDGPTVITAHDASWVRYPQYHPAARLALLRNNFPKALERADRVIVVSEFVRDELISCFGARPERLRVVHNGVSERFRPYTTEETREVLSRSDLVHGQYFAAVGTLEPRKNLLAALDAHTRLPMPVRRKFPLVLVGGDGWMTESLHTALVKSLNDGTVRRLGYVPDEALPLLTAGALALLYPSMYEGFGLPVLEAMASGVPVICSNARALVEVTGNAGLIYDPDDIAGFADAMQMLIDDSALRALLVARGKTRAQHFSWRRSAQETLDVYRQVIV